MKTEWSIVALNQALAEDLKMCNSSFERTNCESTTIREIRKLAETKKSFTPGEVAVLEKFGLR